MRRLFLFSLLSFGFGLQASAQTATPIPISVDARLIMDAAGPQQRKSLSAIYLIACPNGPAFTIGTGFLLDSGVVVTNTHVVATCTEQNLFGISTANKRVTFSSIIKDADRDLALLVPAEKLANGLRLAARADNPEPGTEVTTWGYPFAYNGVSPLLSVGYVSGYREVPSNGKSVKHIIVNGAFNHGNSGGPLLVSHNNEVIGVVVLTFNFYPPQVKQFIDGLAALRSGLMIGTATNPDGSKTPISEAQITAMVLNEFYEKTQVMIGEAIAGSELRAMLKEHSAEISSARTP